MKTLHEALKFVSEKYKNTESEYPELKGMSDNEKLKFSIKHTALHSAKLSGKLSAVSEDGDHGGEIEIEKVKSIAVKKLINLLVIADRVGLSADDLLKRIPDEA